MASVVKTNTNDGGGKHSGRFQVTRHIFIENLEEDCDSKSKQKNHRKQSRREMEMKAERCEDRSSSSSSSDSDSWSDDGREFQSNSSQTGRRVSWADELVTVHEYIKDKRKFRFAFACVPRGLSW